jgi:hypothetical protein
MTHFLLVLMKITQIDCTVTYLLTTQVMRSTY